MGKRFGRNKKRRMLEDIALGKKRENQQKVSIALIERRSRQAWEMLENIRKLFGKHFAGLGQAVTVQDRIPFLQLPIHTQDIIYPEQGNTLQQVEYAVENLRTYWAELQGDKLRGSLAVQLKTPYGDIGYAVTDKFLEDVDPKYATQLMLEALRDTLYIKIIEHKGKKHADLRLPRY